jgi:hypothetical protein
VFWLLGVLVGGGIGSLVGLACKAIPARPLVQTLLASTLAPPVAMAVMIAVVVATQSRVGAYAYSVSPAALGLVVGYLLAVMCLYWLLGRMPQLVPHRPVLLAVAGGLLGALPVAWVMSLISKLG